MISFRVDIPKSLDVVDAEIDMRHSGLVRHERTRGSIEYTEPGKCKLVLRKMDTDTTGLYIIAQSREKAEPVLRKILFTGLLPNPVSIELQEHEYDVTINAQPIPDGNAGDGKGEIGTQQQGTMIELHIDDIDSFAKAREISPQEVKPLVPLNLLEDQVQTFFEEIIGENFHQKDWGGEMNDMFTSHVKVGGRRIRAAFMFKGRGLKGNY